MNDDIQSYLQKPKRYDNIDGTGEIFMGLMMLGFALIGCLQRHMPEHSFWTRHGLFFMYAVMAPVLGLGFLIQKLVKRNITFPRTGYVVRGSNERPVATKMTGWLYGAVLGGIFSIFAVIIFELLLMFGKGHPLSLDFARILYIALFVVVYGVWIKKMEQGQRWKWAMLGLMASALVVLAILTPAQGSLFDAFFAWTTLVSGTTWVLSGIATLVVYLRQHQVPTVEQ